MFLIGTSAFGQINSNTGQITGSDRNSVILRKKVKVRRSNGLETKGTPFFHDKHMKGELGDGLFGDVDMKGSFRFNAATGEFITLSGDRIMPTEGSVIIFGNKDQPVFDDAWLFTNDMWFQYITEDDDFVYLVKHIKYYSEGRKASSSKVMDVANKWKRKTEYYRLDDADMLTLLTRREAKKLKLN